MGHYEKIKVLSSSISHMPLHTVFRDSGVAAKHGFELEVDVAKVPQRGKPDAHDRRARGAAAIGRIPIS